MAEGKTVQNASLIIVGSESGRFGERGNPDYAAGKSAVQVGLLQSLRADVGRVMEGARCVSWSYCPILSPHRGDGWMVGRGCGAFSLFFFLFIFFFF